MLDVGCGPGSISQELADLVGPTGSVLGVDNAAAVIDVARAEHSATRHGNLRYEVQDITDLKGKPTILSVVPSLDTVRTGQYPISRFLYLYTRVKPSKEMKAFIDWATGPEGQAIVSKVGYFPIK